VKFVEMQQIHELLERFISGQDRSKAIAGQLEGAIDRAFPEDEVWQDFVYALASYQPGGGPYLYDEKEVLAKCEWALRSLQEACIGSDQP
jgi:hypothetical protein